MMAMDAFDRQLLNVIQGAVPLERQPFGRLAGELGRDEADVLRRVRALRKAGIIREISAIFDAVSLGYRQALVAMSVPAESLDRAGQIAAGHPGVSHCYGRAGKVNLWLTLAVSPRSGLGLEGTADLLAQLVGATSPLVLPTIRRYKLRVHFDMETGQAAPTARGTGRAAPAQSGPGDNPPPAPLDEAQVRAIRALQTDLPATGDPFEEIAAAAGLDVDDLLSAGREFLADGRMRRYAAVLHHRAAGSAANLLVAWRADAKQADAVGPRAAEVAGVSHCYLRPAGPDWPYTLYTMIHGRSEQDCRLAVDQIVATTALREHVELWTTAEFKKRRVPLFGPEEAQWERRHAK